MIENINDLYNILVKDKFLQSMTLVINKDRIYGTIKSQKGYSMKYGSKFVNISKEVYHIIHDSNITFYKSDDNAFFYMNGLLRLIKSDNFSYRLL